MNKSFITNLMSVGVIAIGYFSPVYSVQLKGIGFFAFSGAVTNWMAIHMLFEKVPLLYGSGVIPTRFEDFKIGIHGLVMNQFFTKENIDRFMSGSRDFEIDAGQITSHVNYDQMFEKLVQVVMASPLGGMLGMFGGPGALEPMKEPFAEKMKESIEELVTDKEFKTKMISAVGANSTKQGLEKQIEVIVQQRLDELTPELVKEIIQEMIRKHLGWLVVWGGVFGGLIGLITSLIYYFGIDCLISSMISLRCAGRL